MKKVLIATMALALVATLTGIGFYAQFSDTEKAEHYFEAGSINLTIDGQDGNVITITRTNMYPADWPYHGGSQVSHVFELANTGTLTGYLDISSIVVRDCNENGRIEPEVQAGDTSDDEGELEDVLMCRMWLDINGNGYWDSGDIAIIGGNPNWPNPVLIKDLPSEIDLDVVLNPGGPVKFVTEYYDWWEAKGGTIPDNQAMTDSVTIDIEFKLDTNAND